MKRWSEWVVWSQIDAGNTGNHFSGGTCRFHLPSLVEDAVPDLFRPAIKRCVSLPHRQRPSATMALPARRLCLPPSAGSCAGIPSSERHRPQLHIHPRHLSTRLLLHDLSIMLYSSAPPLHSSLDAEERGAGASSHSDGRLPAWLPAHRILSGYPHAFLADPLTEQRLEETIGISSSSAIPEPRLCKSP